MLRGVLSVVPKFHGFNKKIEAIGLRPTLRSYSNRLGVAFDQVFRVERSPMASILFEVYVALNYGKFYFICAKT